MLLLPVVQFQKPHSGLLIKVALLFASAVPIYIDTERKHEFEFDNAQKRIMWKLNTLQGGEEASIRVKITLDKTPGTTVLNLVISMTLDCGAELWAFFSLFR